MTMLPAKPKRTMPRTENISLRVTERFMEQLAEIKDATNLSQADILESLVDQALSEMAGKKKNGPASVRR
jgi:hypothetical protein